MNTEKAHEIDNEAKKCDKYIKWHKHTQVSQGLKKVNDEIPPQRNQNVFEDDQHRHAPSNTHSFPF